MKDYITIGFLASFAGMIIVLNLLVQFLKPLIDKLIKKLKWEQIHTRYLVWVIAIILSVVYQLIIGPLTVETIFLLFLNSILLTLAAMGNYEATISKIEKGSS